jgi:AraC-like DNA-binding protein
MRAVSEADGSSGIIAIASDNVPAHERIATLREAYARTIIRHDLEPFESEAFYFNAELHRFPGLGIAFMESSAMRADRTAAEVSDDSILINMTLAGGRTMRQHGREAIVGAGDILLVQSGPGLCTIHPGSRWISIRVPRRWLATSVLDLDSALLRPFQSHTASAPLLLGYVGALRHAEAATSPAVRHLVADHIYDLAALVIGATREARAVAERRGLRAARLNAIRDDIAAHFDSRELSINALARRHDISTSYIKKLLAAEGTSFTELVLQQRLRRANRLLLDPRWKHRPVRDIAEAAGFGDLSYFNRAFRKAHGRTPSELRQSLPTGGHEPSTQS